MSAAVVLRSRAEAWQRRASEHNDLQLENESLRLENQSLRQQAAAAVELHRAAAHQLQQDQDEIGALRRQVEELQREREVHEELHRDVVQQLQQDQDEIDALRRQVEEKRNREEFLLSEVMGTNAEVQLAQEHLESALEDLGSASIRHAQDNQLQRGLVELRAAMRRLVGDEDEPMA